MIAKCLAKFSCRIDKLAFGKNNLLMLLKMKPQFLTKKLMYNMGGGEHCHYWCKNRDKNNNEQLRYILHEKSLRFLVKGRLQNRSGDEYFVGGLGNLLFFSPTSEIHDTCTCMRLLEPDQFSHTQSMVAKKGLTNRASRLEHSTAEFQTIQQSGCNWTSFQSQKKPRKLKILTRRSEATRTENRN